MHTFFAPLRSVNRLWRVLSRPPAGRTRQFLARAPGALRASRLADETGDTLIEIIVSALLIALIVVAMLNGFDATSHATASERARSQADALAQQAEDELRSLPISTLSELEGKPRVETIKQNGTTYTVTSETQYVSDATATASCNSSGTSGSYIRTTSTVTWASLGTRKPVVETSIISPPPGSALIVQVTNAASEGVGGMTVTATGPSPEAGTHTLQTAASGCAILALLPGEYKINVSQTGYVDQNWYSESASDPSAARSVYLTAESAVKEPYRFDRAGSLEVEFATESAPSEGDSFVAFNSLMALPAFRQIGTVETYAKTVKSSATVFPFAGSYSVYAGTCEQNNPVAVNPKNSPAPTVAVTGGGKALATVIQPPINIRVMSGTGPLKEGVKVEQAIVKLEEPVEPNGCGTIHRFKTTKEGALPHPGMPFAEYTLCVTGGTSGPAAKRKYTTTFENDTPAGPSELAKMTNGGVVTESGKKVAVIYMGSGAPVGPPGQLKEGTEC